MAALVKGNLLRYHGIKKYQVPKETYLSSGMFRFVHTCLCKIFFDRLTNQADLTILLMVMSPTDTDRLVLVLKIIILSDGTRTLNFLFKKITPKLRYTIIIIK